MGEVAALFIEELPSTVLQIPTLPLNITDGNDGDFPISTQSNSFYVDLPEIAIVISSDRVSIYAAVGVNNDAARNVDLLPNNSQLGRLVELSDAAYLRFLGEEQVRP